MAEPNSVRIFMKRAKPSTMKLSWKPRSTSPDDVYSTRPAVTASAASASELMVSVLLRDENTPSISNAIAEIARKISGMAAVASAIARRLLIGSKSRS
jgi:hypothetical protein